MLSNLLESGKIRASAFVFPLLIVLVLCGVFVLCAAQVPFGVAATCGSVYTGLYIDALPVAARVRVLVRAFALICVAIGVLSLPSTSPVAITTPHRAVLWYAVYGFFCGVWFVG